MKKRRVCILYGGRSGEHEVSQRSAASVARNLDRDKYDIVLIGIDKQGVWHYQENADELIGGDVLKIYETSGDRVSIVPGDGLYLGDDRIKVDIVFPVLHGSFGEDGTVQGLLELADIPYVGAGVLGSALGMDKEKSKTIWQHYGLPVVPFLSVRKEELGKKVSTEEIAEKAIAELGLPLFVKPSGIGSSVGITKVLRKEDIDSALDKALLYDTKVLIEKCIKGREVECSVMGNSNPRSFPPGEIVPRHEFYSYEAKYIDPEGAELIIPARITEEQAELVQSLAVQAFKLAEVEGFARVDFFVEQPSDKVYVNEINTIPGFTSISMFPRMCNAAGLSYRAIIETLLELGFERFKDRRSLKYSL
ncbi:MAG: D-alanine--D-alanine ligase [Spirochaetes bacterium]|nr:MAG: D-alanine--D-alanine ligase [Spirochaetota bacterium]